MFLLLLTLLLFCPLSIAAIDFDGTDDFVNLGTDTAALELTEAISVCAWVKPLANQLTKTIYINLSDVGGGSNAPSLRTTAADTYQFAIDGAGEIAGGTVTTGAWTHVVGTYDKVNMRLYVDGSEVASAAATAAMRGGVNTYAIGNNSSGGLFWNDLIDEVRIYNRALSASEVLTLFNSRLRGTFIGTGLVAYWTMNDGQDATSADAKRIVDSVGVSHGTGDDGANNTGLSWQGESANLSYPPRP